jgi:hypothetical protein
MKDEFMNIQEIGAWQSKLGMVSVSFHEGEVGEGAFTWLANMHQSL